MTGDVSLAAELERLGEHLVRNWLSALRSGKRQRRTLETLLSGIDGAMLRGACRALERALEAGHG